VYYRELSDALEKPARPLIVRFKGRTPDPVTVPPTAGEGSEMSRQQAA